MTSARNSALYFDNRIKARPKEKSGGTNRNQQQLRVGVWDLDVKAGFLPDLWLLINRAQNRFRFHPIEIAVATGILTITEARRRRVKAEVSNISANEFDENVCAQDIFPVATTGKSALGLDNLIVLVPKMILDDSPGEIGCNYFSMSKGKVSIASAHNMRLFASMANRPLEAGLAAIAFAQFLTTINRNLEFHTQTRGCLFDECVYREDVVGGLRSICIEDRCLALIRASDRSAVAKVLETIRSYSR